jgi:hypothetical protein
MCDALKQILNTEKSEDFFKHILAIRPQENIRLKSLNDALVRIANIINTTQKNEILSMSIEVISKLSTFDNALEEQITIDNISLGLQYLLENDQEKAVATYLENILIKNKKISITSFYVLLPDLHRNHKKLLSHIITKWFISGNINLCKAVMDIVGFFIHDSKMILSADINQLKRQNSTTHLFVIRKAIGWLFHHQISAVSFIVSMIEILDENNLKEVENLLFNPIFISYPGSVKDYLNSIKKPKTKTKKVISNLFKRLEKYHNDLDNAWNIKELKPSQEQRESYSRFFNQQVSKTMRETAKDNFMSLIVTEFTILYGRRFVLYFPELSDNPKDIRQETTIQNFEHSIEYPSLDSIDPHGLDYMLRVFRTE